jgi:hypothetical protein
MASILNIPNSFVTFYNLSNNTGIPEYVTDSDCGIQKDFCYPIYDVGDIAFQTQVVSTEVISSVTVYKIPPSGTGIILNDVFTNIVTNGTQNGVPIYNIYFSFLLSDLMDGLFDGDCFQLGFACGTSEPSFFVSNQCFKKIADKCLTTRLQYFNNENAFGFVYRTVSILFPPTTLPLNNYIRLPLYLKEPIISSDKNVYVRSDGSRKLLSARLAKKYKAIVDHVPEETHQNIVVALNHDEVTLLPDNFDLSNGIRCRFEDEYNNNFPEIMQNVSIWSADFTIFETPFNNFNSNCG